MSGSALDRLRERRGGRSPLCLGIDPHPTTCPAGSPPTAQGIEAFARGVIEAGGRLRVRSEDQRRVLRGVRLAGWAALERTRAVPADADASSTRSAATSRRAPNGTRRRSSAYLDADGVTVSPYRRGCEPPPSSGDPDVCLHPRPHQQSIGRALPGSWPTAIRSTPRRSLGRGALAGRPRRAGRRRDGSRRACAIREAVPGPRSSCPASARRGRRREAPARGGRPGARVVNVSRGIASRSPARTGARPPPRRHRRSGRLADAVLHSEASPVRAGRSEDLDRCRFPDLGSSSCCW